MESSSRKADGELDHDRQVFDGWMADHRGIIVKTARTFTTDAASAEDLTQEIALAIWRSVPSFRGESKPSTWIWRIALNRAISWQRRAPAKAVNLDDIAEPTSSDRADDRLLVDRIYDAIQTLSPIDRSLIILSLDGHRYAEISKITGLTETNIGARLSRSRSRLTEQLKETQ